MNEQGLYEKCVRTQTKFDTTESVQKSDMNVIQLVACEYCGNQVPISEVYNATIWKNGDIHYQGGFC
jgi:hypothetical protein